MEIPRAFSKELVFKKDQKKLTTLPPFFPRFSQPIVAKFKEKTKDPLTLVKTLEVKGTRFQLIYVLLHRTSGPGVTLNPPPKSRG